MVEPFTLSAAFGTLIVETTQLLIELRRDGKHDKRVAQRALWGAADKLQELLSFSFDRGRDFQPLAALIRELPLHVEDKLDLRTKIIYLWDNQYQTYFATSIRPNIPDNPLKNGDDVFATMTDLQLLEPTFVADAKSAHAAVGRMWWTLSEFDKAFTLCYEKLEGHDFSGYPTWITLAKSLADSSTTALLNVPDRANRVFAAVHAELRRQHEPM